MRILLCNKFYYHRGGDCIYTLELERLLHQHGHDVAIFAMKYPDNLPSPWQDYFPSEASFSFGPKMINALFRPLGSREVKEAFERIIQDFKPDVIHLGNIHSQLSPLLAEIAHSRGIHTVWTLHDYKLLCPRYDCMQPNGLVCEECFCNQKEATGKAVKSPNPNACLRHHCLKGSLLASFIGWVEMKKWNCDRLTRITDTWICPSQFMLKKMIQGGFPHEKLIHLCNFIDVEKCLMENYSQREDYYCFVGRLSHEKGVETLINAASHLPYRLIIIGDGPLRSHLNEKIKQLCCQDRIQLAGQKNWEQIKHLVAHARLLVAPSEWYENNPLSILEAKCLGTPIIGARIGGIPELINPISNGKALGEADGDLFIPRNVPDLTEKINLLWTHPFNHEQIAKRSQQRFSAESYYESLMKLYAPS